MAVIVYYNIMQGFNEQILVFFVVLFLASVGIHAEESQTVPFNTMGLTIGTAPFIIHNSLEENWNAGRAIYAANRFPFYLGTIRSSIQYSRFMNKIDALPKFSNIIYDLGWGRSTSITNHFAVNTFLIAGIDQMIFEENDVYGEQGAVSEIEFLLGVTGELEIGLPSDWFIAIGSKYHVLYTAKRIRYASIIISLTKQFYTPEWLKEILK